MSLTACATRSVKPNNQVIIEVPRATLPPAELLKDCLDKTRVITTNRELAQAYNDRGDVLALCNADKKALREWRDSLQEAERESKTTN